MIQPSEPLRWNTSHEWPLRLCQITDGQGTSFCFHFDINVIQHLGYFPLLNWITKGLLPLYPFRLGSKHCCPVRHVQLINRNFRPPNLEVPTKCEVYDFWLPRACPPQNMANIWGAKDLELKPNRASQPWQKHHGPVAGPNGEHDGGQLGSTLALDKP